MAENEGRAVPNARLRHIFLGIQDVMGVSGLNTVLRQAGLQRFAGALPPNDRRPGLQAAEYAALLQAIENYYGRGGRGTLLRIGYAAFQHLVASRPVAAAGFQALLRLRPLPARQALVLRWLAREIAGPHGSMTVEQDVAGPTVVDRVGDGTYGRRRDTAICWLVLGEIQEALKWGTGVEYDVTEAACRAKGDEACRFAVGPPVG